MNHGSLRSEWQVKGRRPIKGRLCSFWGTSYPCGSRPNVQINRQKFFGNSSTYEHSELTHETGHSLGLAHHCTSASIMNDGSSSCFGGRFGSAPGYFATDRQGISNVYP